jgi:hypothetical protein
MKGVWIILERVAEESFNAWKPAEWRALLASPGKPFIGNSCSTPEEALKDFENGFWKLWSLKQSDYDLQTRDDYPDGITEYAVRFLTIPKSRLVKD